MAFSLSDRNHHASITYGSNTTVATYTWAKGSIKKKVLKRYINQKLTRIPYLTSAKFLVLECTLNWLYTNWIFLVHKNDKELFFFSSWEKLEFKWWILPEVYLENCQTYTLELCKLLTISQENIMIIIQQRPKYASESSWIVFKFHF